MIKQNVDVVLIVHSVCHIDNGGPMAALEYCCLQVACCYLHSSLDGIITAVISTVDMFSPLINKLNLEYLIFVIIKQTNCCK